MNEYIKRFIEDNIMLIEDRKYDILMHKCAGDMRAKLAKILKQVDPAFSYNSVVINNPDVKATIAVLCEILKDLNIEYDTIYKNKTQDGYTIKFYNTDFDIDDKYDAEQAVRDELDKRSVKYKDVCLGSSFDKWRRVDISNLSIKI